MPRRRASQLVERLGARIRARRVFVCRELSYVAAAVEISKQQLSMYERGMGHVPVGTLHRIAGCLGTTISDLVGEKENYEIREQFDAMIRIYNDPFIGDVIRTMQDMKVDARRAARRAVLALANSPSPQTVPVMQ